MAQFGPVADRFRNAGAAVLFIAAEKRGGLFKPERYLAEHPAEFPFLLDEDRQVTKQYGVYHRLGLDAINIARPATFVIDSSGIVRWIYIGASQTDRAPIDQALAEVERLRS